MRILQLIEAGEPADVRELASLYDALEPVEPADLLGDWSGGDFYCQHPVHTLLEQFKWAGMTVTSPDDVKPVMVWTDDGKRVSSEHWGGGMLREVKFRGVSSTAVLFDNYPIIDNFRRVSDNTLMAMMDPKDKTFKDAGPYFFWIRK